jgi:hypothetical protein
MVWCQRDHASLLIQEPGLYVNHLPHSGLHFWG